MAKLREGPRRKVGRPTKYKEEFCEMLVSHMASGLSFESFAAAIGVSEETLFEWSRCHEEFLVSKKEGFSKNRLFYEKYGIGGMAGRVKNFNSTVWIFNMKNRFSQQWREKIIQEQTISADVRIQSWEDHLLSNSNDENKIEPLPISGA